VEVITARPNNSKSIQKVIFGVRALYGLSRQSIKMSLNETEAIESGQVCVTLDPDADSTGNVRVIDYDQGKLTGRWARNRVNTENGRHE
jgi:hypothetical protein